MIKKRIEQLLDALNKGIYEKENEIALSLLAAVAGESIILLGPPGVAKSMVARRLSKVFNRTGRNYLQRCNRQKTVHIQIFRGGIFMFVRTVCWPSFHPKIRNYHPIHD